MKQPKIKKGRKKADDPKEVISIWIEKSIIKALGGKEMVKDIAKSGVRLSYHKQLDMENNDE